MRSLVLILASPQRPLENIKQRRICNHYSFWRVADSSSSGQRPPDSAQIFSNSDNVFYVYLTTSPELLEEHDAGGVCVNDEV